VIEKAAGDVARCSHDDGASGRLLELPIWMFDRSACAPMRVEAFPRVDIAALQALQVLLDATAIGGVAVGLASSNARVPGAARVSHDQNRGEVHATPTAASTRPSLPCGSGETATALVPLGGIVAANVRPNLN
jgi:hypothetical protein